MNFGLILFFQIYYLFVICKSLIVESLSTPNSLLSSLFDTAVFDSLNMPLSLASLIPLVSVHALAPRFARAARASWQCTLASLVPGSDRIMFSVDNLFAGWESVIV